VTRSRLSLADPFLFQNSLRAADGIFGEMADRVEGPVFEQHEVACSAPFELETSDAVEGPRCVTNISVEVGFVGAHIGAVEPCDILAVNNTLEDRGGGEGRAGHDGCGGDEEELHRFVCLTRVIREDN